MTTAAGTNRRLLVRRDMKSVREALRQIRQSERLAPINLFGRRRPSRMLSYLDRRNRARTSVELPIYVAEVEFDGQAVHWPDDEPREQLALTRDVSLRGIGLAHDSPLSADYAVVTFDLFDGQSISLLLDVRWANIERGFQYLSGGRFVGIVDSKE